MWDKTNVWDKTKVRRPMTDAQSPKKRDWVETAGTSRAGISKISVVEIIKMVATTKDQLDKKIVTLGLYNSLPTITINGGVIAKQKES